jgi:hypothetical protein
MGSNLLLIHLEKWKAEGVVLWLTSQYELKLQGTSFAEFGIWKHLRTKGPPQRICHVMAGLTDRYQL